MVFSHEVTGGHVEDLFAFNGRVELEVEIVKLLLVPEGGGLASGDLAIIAKN